MKQFSQIAPGLRILETKIENKYTLRHMAKKGCEITVGVKEKIFECIKDEGLSKYQAAA